MKTTHHASMSRNFTCNSRRKFNAALQRGLTHHDKACDATGGPTKMHMSAKHTACHYAWISLRDAHHNTYDVPAVHNASYDPLLVIKLRGTSSNDSTYLLSTSRIQTAALTRMRMLAEQIRHCQESSSYSRTVSQHNAQVRLLLKQDIYIYTSLLTAQF